MPSRAIAVLVLLAALGSAARAQSPQPSSGQPAAGKEPSVNSLAARERQKTCGAEWRALPAAEKTAQGPKWPQYYSRCVKRLKEVRA
ncbi:MAG: hypothetical protein PGN34_02940 [Methylobacterium frigidaeris]